MWQNKEHLSNESVFRIRIRIVLVIGFLLFFLLLAKLFYLQIVRSKYFYSISEGNRLQTFYSKAPRGKILSNNGKILVDNQDVYSVVLTKFDLSLDELRDSVKKISGILDIDVDAVDKDLQDLQYKPFEKIVLADDITHEMFFEIKEKLPYLKGIRIEITPVRQYRLGYGSVHFLGYLSEISAKELEYLGNEGYSAGDIIGKNGIEKIYDKYIRGVDGFMDVEVNASGRQVDIIRDVPPHAGNNVYTTIDYDLQVEAEDCMVGKSGSIVVMNPKNGEILACVSSPGFDAIQFLYPLNYEKMQVFNDKRFPMMNRSIHSQYPPGSIYKIITTIAGLEEHIIDKNKTYKCEGKFYLGKEHRLFRCWDKKGHGIVNLHKALVTSCDVYYYNEGLRIGISNLAKYSRMFGLGAYTGVDLPAENKGLVPDPSWKKARFKAGWYDGDTVNMSIGQGFLLVTPIQMANMLCMALNGGELYRPYLVKKIVDDHNKILFENKKMTLRKINLSKETSSFIEDALEEVIESGTGKACRIDGVRIGGKTGTAQNPHGEDHAWFVAAAPVNDPELVICVLVENGGHGGSVAAPLARRIFEKYFKKNNLKL